MTNSSDVHVYSRGLVYCSVCVPKLLSRKELEEAVNSKNPTGIDSRWKISHEDFQSGENNPTKCEHDPKRLHYLMVC